MTNNDVHIRKNYFGGKNVFGFFSRNYSFMTKGSMKPIPLDKLEIRNLELRVQGKHHDIANYVSEVAPNKLNVILNPLEFTTRTTQFQICFEYRVKGSNEGFSYYSDRFKFIRDTNRHEAEKRELRRTRK